MKKKYQTSKFGTKGRGRTDRIWARYKESDKAKEDKNKLKLRQDEGRG